jgi:hypothetical protein
MNETLATATHPVQAELLPRRIGQVVTGVVLAWLVFVLVGGLEAMGRHFVVLGVLRLAMLAALLALVLSAGAQTSRLGRLGLGVAALGAVLNLMGGVGAVVTDGWTYNPFDPAVEAAPPWYAYVIGGSAMVFALGSILAGLAARSAGWPAIAAVLGGLLYPMAFVLQGVYGAATGAVIGHLVWVAPWLALSLALAGPAVRRPRD